MTSNVNINIIREILKPVYADWSGKRFLEELSDDDLQQLLTRARDKSLDQLAPDY